MRTYTREVVSRYLHSPAIWGWEFGNEYNLALDFPDSSRHLPPVNPGLGTPTKRGPHDALTSEIFMDALADFAQTCAALIKTVSSLPETVLPGLQLTNMHTERRFAGDSVQQFSTMLLQQNPGPYSRFAFMQVQGRSRDTLQIGSFIR